MYNPETDAVKCSTKKCRTLVNPAVGICSHCRDEIDRRRKVIEMTCVECGGIAEPYNRLCTRCRIGA